MPTALLPSVTSAARGRWQKGEMPPGAKPWQPGQSGNPSGKGGLFIEAQAIARKATPEAARKLVEMLQSTDERVVGFAAKELREWAWGKIPDYDPSKEDQRQGSFDPSRLSADQLALVKAALLVLVQVAVVPANGADVEPEVVLQSDAVEENVSDINTVEQK